MWVEICKSCGAAGRSVNFLLIPGSLKLEVARQETHIMKA